MSKSENLNMIAICNIRAQAGNMIELVYASDGVAALQEKVAEKDGLTPIAVYHVEEAEAPKLQQLLETIAKSQGGNVYIVPNMPGLSFELDTLLRKYVPGS